MAATKTIPKDCRLTAGEAAAFDAAGGEAQKARGFKMLAYSGAEVSRYGDKMIVDLAGLTVESQKAPALRDHNPAMIAGFTQSIDNNGKQLRAEGQLSSATTAGREVAALSDEGFPWQASIRFDIQSWREVHDGQSLSVNGRTFSGPGMVVTRSRLREMSFTPLGADSNTIGIALSDASSPPVPAEDKEGESMTAEQFAAVNAAAVEAWRGEGRAAALKDSGERMAALAAAFPDRPAFVIEQFSKGHGPDQAKAALADVLLSELAVKDKTIQELRAAPPSPAAPQNPAGHPQSVKFTATPSSTATATSGLPPKQRAKVEWEANAKFGEHPVQDQFGSEEEYAAHLASTANGQARGYERR